MKKQNGENKNYVLDSTAFLALFEDEPGAEIVQKLLERAKIRRNCHLYIFCILNKAYKISIAEAIRKKISRLK